MFVLVDGDHHEVLFENIDLSGPAFDSVVSPGDRILPGLYRRGFLCEPSKPERGEDVDPAQAIVKNVRDVGEQTDLSLSSRLNFLYCRCFM